MLGEFVGLIGYHRKHAIISIPKVYGKRLAHSFHRRYFGVFTTVDHQRKSDRRDFLNCEEGAARGQLSRYAVSY